MTDGYRLISNPFPNRSYFWLAVNWAISRELRAETGSATLDKHP